MIAQHFIFETHKPEVLKDAFKEASVLWTKHGAKEVSLWRLQGSKINNFSFSARCENMEQMGKCMDALLLMLILQHGKGNTLEPLLQRKTSSQG